MDDTASAPLPRPARAIALAATTLVLTWLALLVGAPASGAATSAALVKDISPGAGPSLPSELANFSGTLFFQARDEATGFELWRSDGTGAGTALVKDIAPGSGDSFPSRLTSAGGTLFFMATDEAHGSELWTTDGTAAGTSLVTDIRPGPVGSVPSDLTDVDGTLYFSASDETNGSELWRSDGTAAGTRRVKDINPGTNSSIPFELTDVDGTLYFTATDGATGFELWKSDGTTAGTTLVKDIRSGSAASNPFELTNAGGTLYFTATDSANGLELWKSDGTTAGTTLVKNINPGANSSNPAELTNAGGTLYFKAFDGVTGFELWKSDGTTGGTVLVKDIRSGAASSAPLGLTYTGGTLYFAAFDNATGFELWKSDGTTAGTTLVKDIWLGSNSSLPSELTNAGGTLYFTASDGTTGVELWASDGTGAGTKLVNDILPGGGTSSPSGLTDVDGTLYFAADDGSRGAELWRTRTTTTTTTTLSSSRPSGSTYGDSVTFTATVASDPATAIGAGTVAFQQFIGSSWVDIGGCSDVALGGITGNVAQCSTAALTAGSKSIRAVFGGTTDYAASTSATLTQNVFKATVHVDANAAQRIYGDADPPPSATLRASDFRNGNTAGTSGITGGPGCAYAGHSQNVGTHGGVISCSAGSLSAANYSFATGDSAALTINKASLRVDSSAAQKTYGNADPAPSATLRASDFRRGDTAATIGFTGAASCQLASHSENAATYPGAIACAVGTLSAANYSFTTGNSASLTINKAIVRVDANAAQKIYGDPDPTPSATLRGSDFKGSDTAGTSDLTGEPSCQISTPSDEAGTHTGAIACNAGTLSAPNYLFLAGSDAAMTIDRATVHIDANAAQKTYGDPDPTPGAALRAADFKMDDTAGTSGITGEPNCQVASHSQDVGTYSGAIACTDGTLSAHDYLFSGGSDAALTIGKASVHVDANAAQKTYGEPDPTPAATLRASDFKGSDTAGTSGITGVPSCQIASHSVHAGTYSGAIACAEGTLAAQNYLFTTGPDVDLTIAKAIVRIDADAAQKTYGAPDPAPNGTLRGSDFTSGDTAATSGISGSPSCQVGSHSEHAGTYDAAIGCAVGTLSAPDYSFAAGNSAGLTINKAGTQTAAQSSANPSVRGQSVTLTATVTTGAPGAGTPSGQLTFTDGSTVLATKTLGEDGKATLDTSSLSVGSHAITAAYDGSGDFDSSSGAALSQDVAKAATAASLAATSESSTAGDAVTFNATVATVAPGSGTPGGDVTFKDGAASIGTTALGPDGKATLTTSGLAAGQHSITAGYAGNGGFHASTSDPVAHSVTVRPQPPERTLEDPPPLLGRFTKGSSTADGNGNVTITRFLASCDVGPCLFRVTATIPSASAKVTATRKKKPVQVGSGKLALKTGQRRPIKLKLTRAAKKLLARKGTLAVSVRVTGANGVGRTVAKTVKLKISSHPSAGRRSAVDSSSRLPKSIEQLHRHLS
jgi:ELWxxDGT repeat protein